MAKQMNEVTIYVKCQYRYILGSHTANSNI